MAHISQASDKDEPNTPASTIIYSLESFEFRIDSSTGQIYTIDPLDREVQDMYELVIQAKDQGLPSRSSSITITIKVQDVNDNRPVFLPEEYVVEVSEDIAIDGFLTVQVSLMAAGLLSCVLVRFFKIIN